MAYKIEITAEDIATLEWSGHRYGWSDEFPIPDEPGTVELTEPEAWAWSEAAERDTEGRHSLFPCLDPGSDLAEKLHCLLCSIV